MTQSPIISGPEICECYYDCNAFDTIRCQCLKDVCKIRQRLLALNVKEASRAIAGGE